MSAILTNSPKNQILTLMLLGAFVCVGADTPPSSQVSPIWGTSSSARPNQRLETGRLTIVFKSGTVREIPFLRGANVGNLEEVVAHFRDLDRVRVPRRGYEYGFVPPADATYTEGVGKLAIDLNEVSMLYIEDSR
jgi:hypothetical protein